jgi:ATP-dependent DNA helicase RecG
MEKYFAVGDEVFVYGRPTSLKPRAMDHPETEKILCDEEAPIHLNRIVPIYPATEGLYQRSLRLLMWRAVERFVPQVQEPSPRIVPVGVPGLVQAPGFWPSRKDALRAIHFPNELAEAELGRRRLALDEFVELQLVIQKRRKNLEQTLRAMPCRGDNRLMKPFLAGLPYSLTGAQTRVLREIRADLSRSIPMRRLLQGDVGSGKSLVAGCSALMVLESGQNVALMAPTEILAEQLSRNFSRWFEPLGIRVALHTGSKRQTISELPIPLGQSGKAGSGGGVVTVGTHALLEQSVEMERVGLVIIDEQHKFGVAQREHLLRRGRKGQQAPHLLVMTATPIPRTLGLTLYGDLDVSVLDELPPGRGKIRTHVRTPDALPKVWAFVRDQLAAGRQAYIVYPRVTESQRDEVKAVTREFERVKESVAPHSAGLLHGQLKAAEKERVMGAFRSGELKVLVATSVIEVGVDVPNATVMLIENAEQFGLAQLHQLRGRIGRGGHEAHCILVAIETTEEARERMKVMASTIDGFEIAEADLNLRGVGELIGRQQSGQSGFKFGHLAKDRDLVEVARTLAMAHLGNAPSNGSLETGRVGARNQK